MTFPTLKDSTEFEFLSIVFETKFVKLSMFPLKLHIGELLTPEERD